MIYDYSSLQNGSDIRGVALDTVPGEEVNLDRIAVERLTKGFLFLLCSTTEKDPDELTIAIGRDSRISGPCIEEIMEETLKKCGCKVLSAGLASTPAMFMATVFPEFDADAAVMITASHLPSNRNGMKFFSKKGGFEKGDITDIINFAESSCMLHRIPVKKEGVVESIDLMSRYSKHLRTLIIEGVGAGEKPLSGMKITVDAGNGAGGFYAKDVLEPLGADVTSSQFLEPDGNFPNHMPNPENSEAMESICKRVKEVDADLGIIFDTDVDRASAVDEKGGDINRNAVVALAAALIADDYPGTTVVTDSITSTQLKSFLEGELGLKHMRYKRGYRNVIGKSIELCAEGTDSQLAIETSGHAAYKENYFLDDGAYLATKTVIKAAKLLKEGKGISTVIENLGHPVEAKEVRLPLVSDDFSKTGDKIIEDLGLKLSEGKIEDAEPELPNYEGIRIAFKAEDADGWMLIRKSLHDPLMPVNIESNVEGGCKRISEIMRPVLAEYKELDIEKF